MRNKKNLIVILLLSIMFTLMKSENLLLQLLAGIMGIGFIFYIKKVIGESLSNINKTTRLDNLTNQSSNIAKGNVILKCVKCGNILNVTDQVCKKCGTAFSGDNVQVVEDTSPLVEFDTAYSQTETMILKQLLIEEFQKQGENEKSFITKNINTKKNILLTLLAISTFIFTLMYFFNYHLVICILLESLALLIYCLISKRFNILKILMKEAIKNPDENISTIVKKTIEQKHKNSILNKIKPLLVILIIVIIQVLYFYNPRILYIRYYDGYSVLRYTRGITNDSNIINIPETYKEKAVLSISESAFKNSDVEVIKLPNGLESINTKAFLNCKNLKEIDIPSTVLEIRGSAFENCINLTKVILHEGLKELRGSVFKNNINLSNIDLPNSLEYLGASAFSNCRSLTEITIPKKVIEINGQTFEYCSSLTTVNLHNDIISIHGEVFVGDYRLTNIILPPKITEIRGSTFEGCRSLTTIVIPNGVTRIGGHAFHGCTNLSYVSVPSTVKEIGSSAFRECDSLKKIQVPRSAVINERAFKDSPTQVKRY